MKLPPPTPRRIRSKLEVQIDQYARGFLTPVETQELLEELIEVYESSEPDVQKKLDEARVEIIDLTAEVQAQEHTIEALGEEAAEAHQLRRCIMEAVEKFTRHKDEYL